jgi:uncharacterized damage-inducible protein DinB
MQKPLPTNIFYDRYIALTESNTIADALAEQEATIINTFNAITEEKANYKYAPDKWTLKQMLLHIIDTERIFAYRSLSIVRGETQSLLGFDENQYANNATAENRTWQSLCAEFNSVRAANTFLYANITTQQGLLSGLVGTTVVTPAHFAFATVGHFYHHVNIINQRYL